MTEDVVLEGMELQSMGVFMRRSKHFPDIKTIPVMSSIGSEKNRCYFQLELRAGVYGVGAWVPWPETYALLSQGLHLTPHHDTHLLCLLGQVAYLGFSIFSHKMGIITILAVAKIK